MQRRGMVKAVREGEPLREVARRLGIALSSVQKWVARAAEQRLDRVNFSDRGPGPIDPANKTAKELEDLVPSIRTELKQSNALGEYRAPAIRRAMERRRLGSIPSERTIGRILQCRVPWMGIAAFAD